MNTRLIIGLLLLLPVLFAVFFGPVAAPYSTKFTEDVRYEDTDEGRVIVAPPSPPSKAFRLGTNKWGQDILSLILHGARWTVGTTAVLAFIKVLVGALIGVVNSFGKHRRLKGLRGIPLNAIPLIVFLYFLLAKISMNFPFHEIILVTLFGIIIIIFGTPASASAIETVSRDLMKKEYYVAAVASGGGKVYMFLNHILPFLKERLLTLFVGEMIAILNIIGQLGIFGVFLGATVVTFSPIEYNSRLYDWAGLIGQARLNINNHSWILFGPLGGYILLLLSLYLILEGLKIKFQKDYRI